MLEYIDVYTAAATAMTLLVTVGLTYLFYPALVVARTAPQRRLVEPKVVSSSASTKQQHNVVVLSIIIPAYNEELRLPVMLQEAYDYLTSSSKSNPPRALQDLVQATARTNNDVSKQNDNNIAVEWIVVDDGSKDQTGQVFQKFAQRQNSTNMLWKLVTLPQNSGKGAAVQAGMLAAQGSYCLMVDADGATDFGVGLEALTSFLDKSSTTTTVWLGSRAHLQKAENIQPNIERSLTRRFLAAAFHTLLALTLGQAEIADTQCGFKLFPAESAQAIFTTLHLQRWAFDIEVLYLAKHLKFGVQEVVVPWHEVEGSKLNTSALNLAWVSLSMLRDMICVRLCYLLGIWSVHDGQWYEKQDTKPR